MHGNRTDESAATLSELSPADRLGIALRRVAQGDRQAFEDVYHRTAPKLFGLCLRVIGNRAQAEDVLQEVYCAVWRKAALFDGDRGSAVTWLITITRNLAIDTHRKSGSATLVPIEAVIMVADAAPSACATIERDDELYRVQRCLDHLGARDVAALQRTFFEGATYAELAQAASIPVGTMKSRIRRALLRLRDGLK